MRRKILEQLLAWKNDQSNRKPLLLQGARQVGKTYVLQDFAKQNYLNLVYVNFEKMPVVASFFEGELTPNRIIKLLAEHFSVEIQPQQTLVILDEIQACERALTSLKYFAEDAPEYHIIGAGSLLGVAIHREKYSFPVGKINLLHLYPLDFEEFLWAMGKAGYANLIKEHYLSSSTLPDPLHQELFLLHKQYLAVGGMPGVLKEYCLGVLPERVVSLQTDILNAYVADMAKYAEYNETIKIRGAYDSLSAQLAKENKKFQYKLIRKGATTNLFGSSIEWLLMAGIVLRCYRVAQGVHPLETVKDLSAFKLYFSDIGLYSAKTGLNKAEIISDKLSDQLKCALSEGYVAQALTAAGFNLYYWESNAQAEVDFIIQKQGQAIPVEVKYALNTKSKSLAFYIKKYAPEYSIRISSKNFGFENKIKSVPLYAVFCL